VRDFSSNGPSLWRLFPGGRPMGEHGSARKNGLPSAVESGSMLLRNKTRTLMHVPFVPLDQRLGSARGSPKIKDFRFNCARVHAKPFGSSRAWLNRSPWSLLPIWSKAIKIDSATELSRVARFVKLAQKGAMTRDTKFKQEQNRQLPMGAGRAILWILS